MTEKLIVSATLGDLVVAIQQSLGVTYPTVINNGAQSQQQVPKHKVYGIKGLADLLKVSNSTAWRLHHSGVLAAATYRSGRILIFDEDLVWDILKVSGKRRKAC